jgi:hypothetical protein
VEELDQLDRTSAALAVSQAVLNERLAARAAAIAAAFDAGMPFGLIAEHVGLSAARVRKILGHPRGRVGRHWG